MRVWVAIEPVDFRRGIDGMAQLCRERLGADPFSGAAYVFRNRRGTGVKILIYDGQGFWLCYKRWSKGHFRYWPDQPGVVQRELFAHQLSVLLAGGDPDRTNAAPQWRRVTMAASS